MTIVYSRPGEQPLRALDHVSLKVGPAEVIGMVGESGSGKSTLALAWLRLLPDHARYESGSILFRGCDLLRLPASELRKVRGKGIALISQDPAMSLNPVIKVGDQLSEVIRAHAAMGGKDRKARVHELLEEVGLNEQRDLYAAYPHQLSGGQRQRVAIAQAIACRPALVIADEPTSKLDASLQAEIIELMSEIRRRNDMAFLVISHDLTIFPGFADRIAVMYAGRIVEEASAENIFRRPLHPYTQAMVHLASSSCFDESANVRRLLPIIEGEPLDLSRMGSGCRFEARCPERMQVCTSCDPQEALPEPSRRVSCFKYGN